MADIGINANEVDTTDDFEVIPAGDYKAIITESDLKPTNAGTGDYFKFTFQIVEGQYDGRLVWHNCTRQNPNAQAVQIGQKQLAQIMEATGKPTATRTEDLHNIPVIISLVVKNSEQYGPQNEIKKVKSAVVSAPMPTSSAPQNHTTPPWEK